MKILVTGATGYVGAASADALARAGHDVVRGTRRPVSDPRSGETWLDHGDLASTIDWPSLLAGYDAVVHCAGFASVPDGVSDARVASINVAATTALAEGAARAGVKRFIYMSSALAGKWASGNTNAPEGTDPASLYARSKREAERRVEELASKHGMAWVILRPPMVYGPGCSGNFARLARMVQRGVPLPLASATAPKSFIAIGNLTSAVCAVVEHPAAEGQTFFVSDGATVSTALLIRLIASSLDRPARLVRVPEALLRGLGRLAGKDREIASLFDAMPLDISPIREALGWTPPMTVVQGVRDAFQMTSVQDRKPQQAKQKIVYLATEDWFVASHFLPLLRQARELGLESVVIARVRDHASLLEAEGARVIGLNAERSSFNPFGLLGSLVQLRKILRRERPTLVHCIALRMVVVGGLAARLAGVRKVILAPTGLGTLWITDGWQQRSARRAIKLVVATVLRRPGTVFVFENRDDPQDLGLQVKAEDVAIVPGAGVDPAVFYQTPEPSTHPVKVAVVARMTLAKGIVESIAAVSRARERGAAVELHLFGAVDTSNLGSLSLDELKALNSEPGITWHGASNDIPRVWREHHIAMLLTSYREGVPRSLIEAAACGRPIVATDVVGCREVVRDGVEGLLVPRGDVEAAASALVRLAGDAELRSQLGAAAHQRFMSCFTEAIVRDRVRQIYCRLIGAGT